MAVTVEGTYTSIDKKTTSSTIPNVVVPVSSNRAIYVFISCHTKNAGDGKFAQSVVWDAAGVNEAFTLLGEAQNSKVTVHIYKLLAPTEKTADITITWDDNNSNWDGSVHTAVVMSGVDQTTPDDGWNTNSGTGTAASIAIPTASGDLVYDVVSGQNTGTLTESGDGTEQWNDTTNRCKGGGSSVTANDAQSDMAWTLGSSGNWIEAGVSLNPISGGTAYYQTVTDQAGLLDSVAKKHGVKKEVSDLTGLLDSVDKVWVAYKTVTDITGLADSVGTVKAMGQTVTDLAGLVDSVTTKVVFTQSVTDQAGLLDFVSKKHGVKKEVVDQTGLSDSVVNVWTGYMASSDIAGLSDSVSIVHTPAGGVAGGDSSFYYYRKRKRRRDDSDLKELLLNVQTFLVALKEEED